MAKRYAESHGLNKLCQLSDFPAVLDRAGLTGWPRYRKYWEVAQALDALRTLADLPTGRVLGVGAGTEPTGFLLTTGAAQVHMTDLYQPGPWTEAPAAMLTEPAAYAPKGVNWDPQRLVVQYMDARALRYPDGFFAGVFSSSSIEHIGTLDDVRQAVREMARVLAPGGLLTLATEFKLSGEGAGWPGVLLFDESTLHDTIITPSGCTLVEPLDLTMDAESLATAIDLDACVQMKQQGNPLPQPHIVLRHAGCTFTSVFLALRKP